MSDELENQQQTATNSIPGVPFVKDDPRINREGRPKETEEQKLAKKAAKEFIEDYKNKLAESLPRISPVLIEKAIGGDMQAIKEINDRVMGSPKNIITGGDEGDNPVRHTFEWKKEQ